MRAAVTLRTGGVSAAPYDSLNLGTHVGDDPAAVLENRRACARAVGLPAEPVWLEQVHGTSCRRSSTRRSIGRAPRSDAAVTRARRAPCARSRSPTACRCCSPTKDGSVIGAAHAGWRGLAGGVLEATVARDGRVPARVLAWLGPAIGPEHFEVGDEVRDGVRRQDTPVPRSAFDAQCARHAGSAISTRSRASGSPRWVSRTSRGGGWCTYAERERFFSYRRDGQRGRMAALIWLNP